jgi:Holliday junction DNA helicase RuvB
VAREDGAAVNARDRLVSPVDEPDEKQLESALRPANLDEFVGQKRVRQQLSLVLEASRLRGRSADHVLLSGPPGLGKTTLAMIIAEEMGAPLRISSGPAIQHAGDLAAILSSLTEGEVLFLDEIHRMSRPAEEMLYMAMEDFRVDIVVGKGAGATSIPLDLPPFTLVGATTRAGLLPGPLRDRFGFTGHLEFYSVEELELVLRRSAGLMDLAMTAEGFAEVASRSRGTPRIANRLLRRVRDWALVHGIDRIDARTSSAALDMYEVDARGLDRLDRSVLEALVTKFGGGPVGLSTLAIAVGEETETVETVAEPYLVREGLLGRTPRGRIAMAAAWDHLGLAVPEHAAFRDPGLRAAFGAAADPSAAEEDPPLFED